MNTVETSRVAEPPSAVASNLNSLKDDILWGVKAISEEINRSPRQTFHMLETGHLPARKVGGRWTATRSRLHRLFNEEVA
jgi:hypothetical protein